MKIPIAKRKKKQLKPQTNTQGVQGQKTNITTQHQLKFNEGITK
jgi:hypothetical protein